MSKPIRSMLVVIFALLPSAAIPAQAQQQLNSKSRQNSTWFNAPREIQIIDERPIVRDFREAPQIPQPIQLPPGPAAMNPYSGRGAGALGDDGGGTIPAGGLPIGAPNDPGYRTANQINPNAVPLDKADFNHRPSNISGLPRGPLPGGYTTGIHGKVMPKYAPTQIASAPPSRAKTTPAMPVNHTNKVLNYSPNNTYEQGIGSTSSGTSGASTSVRGSLMTKLLNQVK